MNGTHPVFPVVPDVPRPRFAFDLNKNTAWNTKITELIAYPEKGAYSLSLLNTSTTLTNTKVSQYNESQ